MKPYASEDTNGNDGNKPIKNCLVASAFDMFEVQLRIQLCTKVSSYLQLSDIYEL